MRSEPSVVSLNPAGGVPERFLEVNAVTVGAH